MAPLTTYKQPKARIGIAPVIGAFGSLLVVGIMGLTLVNGMTAKRKEVESLQAEVNGMEMRNALLAEGNAQLLKKSDRLGAELFELNRKLEQAEAKRKNAIDNFAALHATQADENDKLLAFLDDEKKRPAKPITVRLAYKADFDPAQDAFSIRPWLANGYRDDRSPDKLAGAEFRGTTPGKISILVWFPQSVAVPDVKAGEELLLTLAVKEEPHQFVCSKAERPKR